jgi:hypothetical protein
MRQSWHLMRRCRAAVARLALGIFATEAVAIQLENGTFLFDAETPIPSQVFALVDCGADERSFASRQPFAGGFLFAIQCPGNNENFMQTLIFAAGEDGAGAYPLRFYGPDDIKDDFAEVISNLRVYADKNEIGEIFVDREVEERADPDICRTEGRWRLEGMPPEPKLVFWRETPDCEGRLGWQVVVDTP